MNGTGEAGRESHSQDGAPDQRVGVSSSDSGVAIWVGDEIRLRLTWEQKEVLQLLLYYEVDPSGLDRPVDTAAEEPAGTTPQERATASADVIFKETRLDEHLDDPEMQEAYESVKQWFTDNDGTTESGD